jgi:hypothetical protein
MELFSELILVPLEETLSETRTVRNFTTSLLIFTALVLEPPLIVITPQVSGLKTYYFSVC